MWGELVCGVGGGLVGMDCGDVQLTTGSAGEMVNILLQIAGY